MAKPAPTSPDIDARYGDLSPLDPAQPLNLERMRKLNQRPEGWFGTGAASGYVQALLEKFEATHPGAAKDLRYIANEAKWSAGWKDFGRLIIELLDA